MGSICALICTCLFGRGHWLDTEYKTKRDTARDKYVYFWEASDIYSQWHPSVFNLDEQKFICMEQYMMYMKADLFGDDTVKTLVMECRGAKQMKKLGRHVKQFDAEKWSEHCVDIVRNGNVAKFSQNQKMKEALFATYPKLLVEASPYDHIWGVGYGKNDIEAFDAVDWDGLNLLGYVITDVRDELMCMDGVIKESEKTVNLDDHKKYYKETLTAKSKCTEDQLRIVGDLNAADVRELETEETNTVETEETNMIETEETNTVKIDKTNTVETDETNTVETDETNTVETEETTHV